VPQFHKKKYDLNFRNEITANGRELLPLLYFAEGIDQLKLFPKSNKSTTVSQYKERGAPSISLVNHNWLYKERSTLTPIRNFRMEAIFITRYRVEPDSDVMKG
jgi:hypothetical protein